MRAMAMKTLNVIIAIGALFYAVDVTPEQTQTEQWQPWVFGAPCSTKVDIEEGTCILEVRRKPRIRKK